jgi:ABC-type branched-subunit amino acid transport system substrate-binding protein
MPRHRHPYAQKFIKIRAKYGKKPDDVAALTYDACSLLSAAITQAGALDRKKVRDALASVKEFQGVTGQMKFQGTGDPIKSAVILQIKDGKLIILLPPALKTGFGFRFRFWEGIYSGSEVYVTKAVIRNLF